MSEHVTTHDAGELGTLTLTWHRGSLVWEERDPSSGYLVGQWQGTPVLIGVELGRRMVLPLLVAEFVGPDRLRALADEAREDWPPPERANAREEA